MPRYLRPRTPGAYIFFTVALAERGSDLLVREVGRLREAVAATRAERRFAIHAFMVVPDHLHAVWTLPKGDADFSRRWRLIKSRFSRGLPMGRLRPSHEARQERGVWQRRFWGEVRPEIGSVGRFQHRTSGAPAAKPITSVMRGIMPRMSGIAT